jgi:hypothetical protein
VASWGYLLLVVIVVANVSVVAWLVTRHYLRWRGARLVHCPETHETVAVEVDAADAVRAALRAKPGLHLKECSRWPERAGCGQECLQELEASPDDCLVRNILTRWYADKTCALCGKPLGTIVWHDHKPGLLSPDGKPFAWPQVSPESVPRVLETHRALCWDCLGAESFRSQFPNRVVDRA